MAYRGYPKDRFPNLQGQIFDCMICNGVVLAPQQCSGCGNLFCSTCIDEFKRINMTCPNLCKSAINAMSSKALLSIYNDLDIKCSKGCNKLIKMIDLPKHQQNCNKVKCTYFDICLGYQNPKYSKSKNQLCSQKCLMLFNLLQSRGNIAEMYKIVSQVKANQVISNIISASNSFKTISSSSSMESLRWDVNKSGMGLKFQNNTTSVFLKQPAYVFRSIVTTKGFMSGQHYWEIIADNRTENQLKIGVSGSNSFDYNTAFCDHIFGFSYYGLAQLRHGSNSAGSAYGKKFKKDGVLGVYLNMDKGTLSFSLNGQYFGVAYTDSALKIGPLFPAVALLHCAGCTIRGQLSVPMIFK